MSAEYESDTERAVAGRLSRLATMPVDTSRLDKLIRAEIRRDQPPARWTLPLRSFRAIAASLVVLSGVVIGVILLTSGGEAQAQATQMAQVHEDMISGRIPVMQV